MLISIAKAVHFLHTGMIPGFLKNRLKTNNILINEHWMAKLSDYGLSIISEETDACGVWFLFLFYYFLVFPSIDALAIPCLSSSMILTCLLVCRQMERALIHGEDSCRSCGLVVDKFFVDTSLRFIVSMTLSTCVISGK